MINLAKIGYRFYKIDLDLETVAIKKELRELAKTYPNIVNENRTLGGSDFECDIEARGHDEFKKILDEIREAYGDRIRTSEYYLARKIHTISYCPSIEIK